jgi:hypothetical protein
MPMLFEYPRTKTWSPGSGYRLESGTRSAGARSRARIAQSSQDEPNDS